MLLAFLSRLDSAASSAEPDGILPRTRKTQSERDSTQRDRTHRGGGVVIALTCLSLGLLVAMPVSAQRNASEKGPSAARDEGDTQTATPKRKGGTPAPGAEVATDPMDHFRAGREHYQAGRYREAAVELKKAYDLDPTSPTLVYNLARVYELLPDHEKAIEHYERYHALLLEKRTAKKPLTEELEQAEMALQRVRGAMAEHVDENSPASAVETNTVVIEVPADQPRYGRADTLFWVVGAGGALTLLGATMLGVTALGLSGQLDDFILREPTDGAQYDRMNRRLRRVALATDIVLGLSVAAFAGAAALYFLRPATEKDAETGVTGRAHRPRWGVQVGPEGVLFTVGAAL